MTTAIFLCDGKDSKCCDSFGCYMNGGECRHTSDLSYRIEGLGTISRFRILDCGEYGIRLVEVQDE